MLKSVQPDIGFQGLDRRSPESIGDRLQTIALAAVRRRFSPEFVNRIDVVNTYRPLGAETLATILDHHIEELQGHVHTRMGDRSFTIDVTPAARRLLIARGTSQEYGARELRRTIHRMLTQPLAALVVDGAVAPHATVTADAGQDEDSLVLRADRAPEPAADKADARPLVMVLDENVHLVKWLEQVCGGAGVTTVTAASGREAREIVAQRPVDLAIVDLVLPDEDGLAVVRGLLEVRPGLRIVVTTGAELSPGETAFCETNAFPVLHKPFLPETIVEIVRADLARSAAAGG
jgi:CheY-like chemotaxis protein